MEDEEIPPSPDIEISFRTRRKRLSKRQLSFVSESTRANNESNISENCNEILYDRIYGEADAIDTEELFGSQDIFPDPVPDLSQTLVINETSDSGNEMSEDDEECSNLRDEQLNDKLQNFLDKQISSGQHFSRQNMLKVFSCSSKDNPTTSKIENKVESKEANIDIMAPFMELEMCSLTRQNSVKITQKFSQLCQSKDFMTAEVYHEKETDVGHQSLRDIKSTNDVTQPKVVYSMADAVLEDFDNFDDPMVVIDNSNEDELKDYRSSDDDDEELNQSIFMTSSGETQPNQVEFLNSSLEALSQKLRSFSQHHLSLSPATSMSALANVDEVDEVKLPMKEMEVAIKRKSMRNPRLSTELEDQPSIKKQKTEVSSETSAVFIQNDIQKTISDSNNSSELPTEAKFSGFSMASGRKLKFNEDHLKKIASNFAKEDEKFENEPQLDLVKKSTRSTKLPQKIETPKPSILSIEESPLSTASTSKFSGFSMASGRALKFNEDHLKKIASNFAKEDEKFENEPQLDLVKKSSRSTKLPQKIELPKPIINDIEESPLSTASTSKFSGFSMASGRALKFNEDHLKKIASSFAKEDEKFENEPQLDLVKKSSPSTKLPQKIELPKPIINDIEESPLSTASTSKFSGFSMASGRALKFNEDHLKKIASNFAKEDEKFENEPQLNLVKKSSRSTKLPQKIELPKPIINDIEESPLSTASTSKFSGFSMASGRALKFNEDHLKKIASNFAKEDEKFENESGFELLQNSSHSTKLPKALETPKPLRNKIEESPLSTASTSKFSGFSMASGRALKFNEDHLKKIASNFEKVDEIYEDKFQLELVKITTVIPDSPEDYPLARVSTSKFLNLPIMNQLKKIAKKVDFTAESNSDNLNRKKHFTKKARLSSTPIKKKDISLKRKLELDDFSLMCSPVMKSIPRIVKTEDIKTPAVNKQQLLLNEETPTESQEVESVLEICMDLEDSIENIQQLPKKRRTQTKLLTQFNQSNELNCSWNDVDMELLKTVEMYNNIHESVRSARRIAMETQLENIVHKEQSLCCPVVGKMFEKKQGVERMKINTYVEEQKPKELQRHEVTFETALDYHFNMQNYLSEEICLTNIDGISVGDGATVYLNETSTVTYNEIKSAFLNMHGVDPKLANDKWIKNAFKFIILKLVYLENSFEKFEKYELLSPDNVMLHLKYRYDCEIDRCMRPAIRKIVEKDDVPSKRIVLKVCDIKENSSGCQLELTDGYYSIPTCIDAPLADAVSKRKIVIGTKLIVSGAELENCENGFDPLTMPKDVKLKIHANSTRKGNWDVELGYYKVPMSLPISLDSVLPTGGVIGRLKVFVTHVYPMLYVDASSDAKVIRNEKVQNRFQNQRETRNLEVVEQIFSQVQREYETELKCRVDLLNISGSKINADTNIEDLCDLLEIEGDPESVASLQCHMTKEQMRKVEKLKEERNSQQRDDIQKRIRKLMGDIDKSISQLLKFRVVSASHPKATALVSVWRPSEDVVNTVKTGKTLEILNSKANPNTFGNEISITVGQSSSIKVSRTLITHNYEKFMRKDTPIAEITPDFTTLNSELDVACVIVKISEEKINNFQPVYVADWQKNLLSINFWMNFKDFACEDTVKEGNIIYIKNLQWRESSKRNTLIPSVFANEYTTFVLNPSQQEIKDKLEVIKYEIEDIDKYIARCQEKIIEIRATKELPKDKENVKQSGRNDTINSSTSSVSSPVTLNQRRMDTTGTPNLQTPDIKRRIMRLTAFDNLPPFKPTSFINKFKNAAFKKPF